MTAQNASANLANKDNKDAPKTAEALKKPADVLKAKEGSLQVYQSGGFPLPQNRPIEPSHLNVVSTYNAMGIRPVIASGLNISSSMVLSGQRPITKSSLNISEIVILGNRPVASNEIEDINTLIGYLD
ncbi:hypothetical protein PN441_03860 [Spirulina major CS-329]|uniref:hypothetical protein n=1 Tax=Spirulina TaxID=1154 RepID=UPI00232BE9C2|nr:MULTISPECIES: hypothetical protein [Spirulina]MDB9495168.1 hypothetical protein [Spirulina subsalsa CS-330]MDB9502194.1 hypothetical protein [Spirulina major CS-329]